MGGASPVIMHLGNKSLTVTASPLSQSTFSPFGSVVSNPAPDLHPSSLSPSPYPSSPSSPSSSSPYSSLLPAAAFSSPPGILANQGSAIKYPSISPFANLYPTASSGIPGKPVISLFVCAARARLGGDFCVTILERHPFTAQTFSPLAPATDSRYLVIVAPSLPSSQADEDLPVPSCGKDEDERRLPGRGLPDLEGLRAFVATGRQAVTYGAGTWHAPMVALGPEGTVCDFMVVQFANGVPIEDCQEVLLDFETSPPQATNVCGVGDGRADTGRRGGSGGIVVRIPMEREKTAKL